MANLTKTTNAVAYLLKLTAGMSENERNAIVNPFVNALADSRKQGANMEAFSTSILFIPQSYNTKTGPMCQTYSAASTCPSRCPFHNKGCYANSGKTKLNWDRTLDCDDNRLVDSPVEFYEKGLLGALQYIHKDTRDAIKNDKDVSKVQGPLLRLNIAGDFAYNNDNTIDKAQITGQAWAIKQINQTLAPLGKSIKAYAYTHCEQSLASDAIINDMHTEYGVTINYSCETLEQVVSARRAHIPAVIASANVQATIEDLAAKHGVKALQCPNQTKGLTCAQCKLCAKFDRAHVVVFATHGAKAKQANEALAQINFKNI